MASSTTESSLRARTITGTGCGAVFVHVERHTYFKGNFVGDVRPVEREDHLFVCRAVGFFDGNMDGFMITDSHARDAIIEPFDDLPAAERKF